LLSFLSFIALAYSFTGTILFIIRMHAVLSLSFSHVGQTTVLLVGFLTPDLARRSASCDPI
jgi:hypothetical protein